MKKLLLAVFIATTLCAQDGTLDTTFGINGYLTIDTSDGADDSEDYAIDMTILPDGRIALLFTTFPDIHSYLAMVNPDGSMDTSFGNDGLLNVGFAFVDYGRINHQTNDQILIGYQPPTNDPYRIVRVVDEAMDMSFGVNGELFSAYPDLVDGQFMVLSNNDIIMWGKSPESPEGVEELVVMRYDQDGELDTSFGQNGIGQFELPISSFYATEALINNSGYLVFLATSRMPNLPTIVLIMMDQQGELAVEFGIFGFAQYPIEGIDQELDVLGHFAQLPNSKYYIAAGLAIGCDEGDFINFHLKINGDSSIPNFGTNGILYLEPSANIIRRNVIPQNNGRVLITGEWTDCFEWSNSSAIRYFDSGHVDSTFQEFIQGPEEMDHQESRLTYEGQLLVLGTSPWFNGTSDVILARYNNNPLSTSEYTQQQIAISPNPSNGIFRIQSPDVDLIGMAYQVADISGKIVLQGSLEEQIDLSFVESGIYFLKLAGQTVKLLKQ